MHSNEARFEALHDAANHAALYLAGQRETVIPAAPANDQEQPLEPLLTATLAILGAVERIELVEGHYCDEDERCACDAVLCERAEVLDLAIAVPLRRVRVCSTECAAYALLWELHPTQDQSDATRDRVMAMIERSFAQGGAL